MITNRVSAAEATTFGGMEVALRDQVETRGAGARKRARFLIPRALLLLTPLLGPCALVAPVGADPIEVKVTIEHEVYQVRARFEAPVSRGVAWGVLTDYDRLAGVVRSLKTSHVEWSDGDRRLVRQEGVLGAFPLRSVAHVLLDVRELDGARIAFRDSLRGDFRSYDGDWSLDGDRTRVAVTYRLDARPVAAAPHILGRGVLSHTVHDMLGDLRREMIRRAETGTARTP